MSTYGPSGKASAMVFVLPKIWMVFNLVSNWTVSMNICYAMAAEVISLVLLKVSTATTA